VKKVKLSFAKGLEVEFVNRERAVEQIYSFGERGTRFPIVVFGPEGCGKSAWLKQAVEIFREQGFEVIYTDFTHREFIVHTNIKDVTEKLIEIASEVTGSTIFKLADTIISLAKDLLRKWRKKKIALLIDEVFHAIGLDKAEVYVKSLLNLIEYPPESYENIVIIVATSEGLSRWRIGRHLWALTMPMWNMSKKGFEELYEKIPKPKPSFEEIWRLAGGNPRILSMLFESMWSANTITSILVEEKRLTQSFVNRWRNVLEKAVEDPDILWNFDFSEEPVKELIERNLVVYFLRERSPELWIDQPPPDKDPELGVGRHVAWQTPLHREAVRKALNMYR
jgi:predicted AAA+ superfamily ATPase